MTNGQQVVAYISPSDIQAIGASAGQAAANAISKALADRLYHIENNLEKLIERQDRTIRKIEINTSELENNTVMVEAVKRRITDIERAKAEAKNELTAVRRVINKVVEDAKRMEQEEAEIIQQDYDRNMEELIRDFVQDTQSTHTSVLKSIKDEFKELTDLKESMLDGVQWLNTIQSDYYKKRKDKLGENKIMVLQTIQEFQRERENIQRRITKLQSSIKTRRPTEFLYPYWIIGIDDGIEEEFFVLPIQESNPPLTEPTDGDPYIDHLHDHKTYGIAPEYIGSALWHHLVSQSYIKEIQHFSILPQVTNMSQDLQNLVNMGYCNKDFINSITRFYGDDKGFDVSSGQYAYSDDDVGWDTSDGSSYKTLPPPKDNDISWSH